MIEYSVSEWGFHTEFMDLNSAIQFCTEQKLLDGKEGMLWISSEDRNELDNLIENNADHTYMRFDHITDDCNFVWCSVYEEWENSEEQEQEALEDLNQKRDVRLRHIYKKYGREAGNDVSRWAD
jgi:hypothetical protein